MEALRERVGRERAAALPDEELIRRIEFLKAVVVVSSESTNEPAFFTAARREAKRWNAVENFCRPFDMEDPDKTLTGIAFLVVCDMLQAIARVNRVADGKQRGFIVDYIGLANHLTHALSIYAEEDAEDLKEGLKSILSELPILEERYQRLLQHFRAAGIERIEGFVKGKLSGPAEDIEVVQIALRAMKDVRQRADFEVFFKKFLQSLNLILPDPAGHAYRGAAARFG